MLFTTLVNKTSLLAQATLAQATDLGTLEAPSEAFAPTSGEEAAGTLERLLSVGIGGITIIAGLYFIITFVMAAFSWLSAGGDAGKVEKARDSMINAVIGLIIIVALFAIVGVIGSLIGIDLLRPAELIESLVPGSSSRTPAGGGGGSFGQPKQTT